MNRGTADKEPVDCQWEATRRFPDTLGVHPEPRTAPEQPPNGRIGVIYVLRFREPEFTDIEGRSELARAGHARVGTEGDLNRRRRHVLAGAIAKLRLQVVVAHVIHVQARGLRGLEVPACLDMQPSIRLRVGRRPRNKTWRAVRPVYRNFNVDLSYIAACAVPQPDVDQIYPYLKNVKHIARKRVWNVWQQNPEIHRSDISRVVCILEITSQ